MKVRFGLDSWSTWREPVEVTKRGPEISKATFKRWIRVIRATEKAQDEMRKVEEQYYYPTRRRKSKP